MFSELLATSRELLEGGQRVLITVDVRADDAGRPGHQCATAGRSPGQRKVDELQIVIEDEEAIPASNTRETGEPGKCKVALIADIGDHQEVEVKLPKNH